MIINCIINNKIHHNAWSGISFLASDGGLIFGNEIYNNYDDGIYIGSKNVNVINNAIYNHTSRKSHTDGVQLYLTDNVKIINNSIFNTGQPIWMGPADNFNTLIKGNLIVNSSSYSLVIHSSSDNLTVEQNTILDSNQVTSVIIYGNFASEDNITIKDNIIDKFSLSSGDLNCGVFPYEDYNLVTEKFQGCLPACPKIPAS